MADFLEPGRTFARPIAPSSPSHVPLDFDGVFRQVVRMRLEWSLREGKELFPEAVGALERRPMTHRSDALA